MSPSFLCTALVSFAHGGTQRVFIELNGREGRSLDRNSVWEN